MSIVIQIGNTVINFPSSAESPNWSEPIIDFAEAVQNALSGVVGPADVFPQTFDISPYNPGSNVIIPNLTFSTTTVSAAFIRYSVFRSTTDTTVTEAGTMIIVYNSTGTTGSLWNVSQQRIGNASISFYTTDTGQVQLNTTLLPGLNHTASITYAAQALLLDE